MSSIKNPILHFLSHFLLVITLISPIATANTLDDLKQSDPQLVERAISKIHEGLQNAEVFKIEEAVLIQLATLLSDDSEEIAESAASLLWAITESVDNFSKPVMDLLIAALKEKRNVYEVGGAITASALPRDLPVLSELANSNDAELQEVAITTIGKIGHEEGGPVLVKTLENGSSSIRSLAAKAIGKIPYMKGEDALITALADKDTQYEAAIALGELRSTKAVPALIAYIKTEPYDDVIKALEKIGDPRTKPFLIASLESGLFYDDTVDQAIEILEKLSAGKEAFTAYFNAVKNPMNEDLTKTRALSALGKLKDYHATSLMLKILNDTEESFFLRQYAAKHLGTLGNPKAAPVLLAYLRGERRTKASFTEVVAQFASSDMNRMLKDVRVSRDDNLVGEAALALGLLNHKAAIEPLLEKLEATVEAEGFSNMAQEEVKMKAAEALGIMRVKRAVEPLKKLLKYDDERVKKAVLKALGEINDPSAMPAIILTLKDKNEYVRAEAADTLGKFQSADAAPALLDLLKDTSSSVRSSARKTLATISDDTLLKHAINTLLNEKADPEYRKEMAALLGLLQQSEAITPLIKSLQSTHWQIRMEAAEALGILKANAAVGDLQAALADEQWTVRSHAARALSEIADVGSIPALIEALDDRSFQSTVVDSLCVFNTDPRVVAALAHVSRHGRRAYIRKKTRCE